MIVTVFIPMTKRLSMESAFLMNAKGTADEYMQKMEQERLQAEAELNSYLNDHYIVLHADKLEDSKGVMFAYQLFKPDGDHRYHLTANGRAAMVQLLSDGESVSNSAE